MVLLERAAEYLSGRESFISGLLTNRQQPGSYIGVESEA
jgi:hypothetical protein